jgi:hypothetical protein
MAPKKMIMMKGWWSNSPMKLILSQLRFQEWS